MLFKGAAENAFTGKTGMKADILNGKPGIFQQVSGGADSGIDKVFMRRIPGFFLKGADEMILAQAGHPRQKADRDVFGEMLVDIGNDFLRHAAAVKGAGAGRGVQEENSEDIRQVFGQQRFPDGASGLEGLKDCGKLIGNGLRVRQAEGAAQM